MVRTPTYTTDKCWVFQLTVAPSVDTTKTFRVEATETQNTIAKCQTAKTCNNIDLNRIAFDRILQNVADHNTQIAH